MYTRGMDVVGGTTPLRMSTIFLIGLVERRDETFVLIRYSILSKHIIDPSPQLESKLDDTSPSLEFHLEEIQSEI